MNPSARPDVIIPDMALAEELAVALTEAGYSADAITARTDTFGKVPPDAGDDRLETLIQLFLRGRRVERRVVASALSRTRVNRLLEGGVLAGTSMVQAAIQVTPFRDLLIASDRAVHGSDVVPGPNPSATTLVSLTIRRPAEATLDLGTGNGIQALLASPHSRTVVGTDVNRRALAFAEFNARLNRLANLEFGYGSWFEPVGDRSFDLIVSNPPYVISPDSTLLFRDSDLPDDEVSRHLITAVPAHLAEGGWATVACNWVHEPNGEWSSPVRDWLEGRGCDAVVLRYATEDPESYARRWVELIPPAAGRSEPTVRRWIRYYERAGIRAIASGAVVLQRRSGGSNWIHDLTVPEGPSGAGGEQLLRIFSAHQIAAASDAVLRSARFRPVEGSALDQSLRFRDGSYEAEPALVSLSPGIGATVDIDPRAIHVVLALDGRSNLDSLIRTAHQQTGLSRTELDQAAVSAVRGLVSSGLIEWVPET